MAKLDCFRTIYYIDTRLGFICYCANAKESISSLETVQPLCLALKWPNTEKHTNTKNRSSNNNNSKKRSIMGYYIYKPTFPLCRCGREAFCTRSIASCRFSASRACIDWLPVALFLDNFDWRQPYAEAHIKFWRRRKKSEFESVCGWNVHRSIINHTAHFYIKKVKLFSGRLFLFFIRCCYFSLISYMLTCGKSAQKKTFFFQ